MENKPILPIHIKARKAISDLTYTTADLRIEQLLANLFPKENKIEVEKPTEK